ncbi:MAG: phosphoenolpyruvate--protein phosphotransferase, partial [Desulfovibrio sp.]|nr:phosphoenolpyruvate--protein phosphotransferase [Desulfovibrio sp.]
QRFKARAAEYEDWESSARTMSQWPADTMDGLRVDVLANIERADEAATLESFGADGIGLYRTEFSFLGRQKPTEESLYEEYRTVAEKSPGKAVIRTLDAGADKLLDAQEALKEPNPALGLRGIRYTLRHPDIFRSQLSALLRAGANLPEGRLSILLPLIDTVEEVRAVKRIMQELSHELTARHIPHAEKLPVGVMVETPAAALIADALARECEFFSIGTNDLIHYLMAIDRNNRHVAYLNQALHPAVVRSLKRIIDAGHREGIRVSACGELSSDPYGIVLLLGMGIDAVSASPSFLPGIKHLIRKLNSQACNDLAGQLLMSTDISACKQMLNELLQRTLGRELSFHTSTIMGTPA